MAGVQVKVTVHDEAIQAAIGKLQSELIPAALKNIGIQLAKSTQQRITDGVDPEGKPFAPLTPEYAAHKKGPGILRETGALQASIHSAMQGQDAVMVGTDRIYGAAQQFGATIAAAQKAALAFKLGGKTVIVKSVTLPARPFLGVSADDEAEILRVIEDHAAAIWGGP